MASQRSLNRNWLLGTARALADELKLRSHGTQMRIRLPRGAAPTFTTEGWSVIIGNLGSGQPQLEIWLDRFAGYPERKLYAGFYAHNRLRLKKITQHVGKRMWPIRTVTPNELTDGAVVRLDQRMPAIEFGNPIVEHHVGGNSFYGFYHLTRGTPDGIRRRFCTLAAAFFEDVSRSLPQARQGFDSDVFPRVENRNKVESHLRRERSRLLAVRCKERDKYTCQVCGFRFIDDYGTLGDEFAEAHHIVPLAMLRENVKTRLEDLATVCANCHRMVHRMDGKQNDFNKLKNLVRNHRR